MDEVIIKVIVKTTRKSINSYEKEEKDDMVFNFHEGNTVQQHEWLIGKISREIITELLERAELPF